MWERCGDDPDVLIDHSISLGLRDPDEPTVAMMAFLCTYRANGSRMLRKMPLSIGKAAVKAMKRTSKARCQQAELITDLCMVLPDDPREFRESNPFRYEQAIAEELPMPCPIPAGDRADLLKRFPQRMGRKKVSD